MICACPLGSEPAKLQFQAWVSSLATQFQPLLFATFGGCFTGNGSGTGLACADLTGAAFFSIFLTVSGFGSASVFSSSGLLAGLVETQTHSLLPLVCSQLQLSSSATGKFEYNNETKNRNKRQCIDWVLSMCGLMSIKSNKMPDRHFTLI